MAKLKRYPRARSPLHAMFLSNQGLPVRKPLYNDVIGPATPSRLIALFRERYSFDDDRTTKILGLLNIAASGKAIKYGDRVAMMPGGQGRVIVQISRQRNTNRNRNVPTPKASLIDDAPTNRRQITEMVSLLLQEADLARSKNPILHIELDPAIATQLPSLTLTTHSN